MKDKDAELLLGSELFELATKHGGSIRETTEITRFIDSGIPRRCFYIEFADGQKIKGRICTDTGGKSKARATTRQTQYNTSRRTRKLACNKTTPVRCRKPVRVFITRMIIVGRLVELVRVV